MQRGQPQPISVHHYVFLPRFLDVTRFLKPKL